ncbi:hypothetical protein BHE74_00024627 [Ensete ventricosum]|nr:hypothetical protein BHE74_00024627 [Ensete ventricosum]
MNLSPSNLDVNLSSTPFLDPDLALPSLDDPDPELHLFGGGAGGTRIRGGNSKSSERGSRKEGGEDLRTFVILPKALTEGFLLPTALTSKAVAKTMRRRRLRVWRARGCT